MRKTLIIVGCIGVLALVAAACATSDSGQASGSGMFPTHSGDVRRVAGGAVKLGSGTINPFIWSVYAERGGGREKSPCLALSVVGPLHEFPGGAKGGEERGETKCGPSASHQGQVLTVPVGTGDSWTAFDVGVAAYEQPISQVRLTYPDGSSALIRTRRLGRDLDVPGLGSLHYAVFAVEGCASKVSGLEKGRIVTTASDWECEAG
jgi:hypothetical protein